MAGRTDLDALSEHFGTAATFLTGQPIGAELTNIAGQRFRKHGEGDWRMLDEAAGPGIESVVIIGPLLSPQADAPAVVPSKEPS